MNDAPLEFQAAAETFPEFALERCLDRITCPYPSAIHARTALTSERTLHWAEQHGLADADGTGRQHSTERYSWLVGRFYPVARESALQLISDWTSWLFWHDDVCDETELGLRPQALATSFSQFLAQLSGRATPRPGERFDRALADLSLRFHALAPDPGWYTRFIASVSDYFEACVWEARNRAQGVVPSVTEYLALRRCASGMWIYLDFVELAHGQSLPLRLRKDMRLQRLAQITNHVAAWHNDLFSLEKERRRGDVHNLALVIQAEHSLELTEAMQRAVNYANDEVRCFTELERRVKSSCDGLPEWYVDALKSLMRGNLDWSLGSARYRAPGATAPVAAAEAALLG